MTTPTPAEIAEALDTLRRVPGVTDGHCLEDIDAFRRNGVPDLGRLASMIEDTAKRHGLRITSSEPASTPPGTLIGYAAVDSVPTISGWGVPQMPVIPNSGQASRESSLGRAAAVYLLPAEGQR